LKEWLKIEKIWVELSPEIILLLQKSPTVDLLILRVNIKSLNRPGECSFFGYSLLEKDLKRVSRVTIQSGEKATTVVKISEEDFGYVESEMTTGNCLEDLLTGPS